MPHIRHLSSLAAAVVALACTRGHAEAPVDPATLYEVSTAGTSTQLKAGAQGVFVLSIQTSPTRQPRRCARNSPSPRSRSR